MTNFVEKAANVINQLESGSRQECITALKSAGYNVYTDGHDERVELNGESCKLHTIRKNSKFELKTRQGSCQRAAKKATAQNELQEVERLQSTFERLCGKYEVKLGLAPQVFANLKKAIDKSIEAEKDAFNTRIIDENAAIEEQIAAFEKKIASFKAKQNANLERLQA